MYVTCLSSPGLKNCSCQAVVVMQVEGHTWFPSSSSSLQSNSSASYPCLIPVSNTEMPNETRLVFVHFHQHGIDSILFLKARLSLLLEFQSLQTYFIIVYTQRSSTEWPVSRRHGWTQSSAGCWSRLKLKTTSPSLKQSIPRSTACHGLFKSGIVDGQGAAA